MRDCWRFWFVYIYEFIHLLPRLVHQNMPTLLNHAAQLPAMPILHNLQSLLNQLSPQELHMHLPTRLSIDPLALRQHPAQEVQLVRAPMRQLHQHNALSEWVLLIG